MRGGLRRGVGALAAGTVLAAGLAARQIMARPEDADLRGAVALVTGGSRGLGLALSRELAREGCRLAICARDETELTAARTELERRGAEVLTIPCDVADPAQVAAMIEAVTRHYGPIDVLVNNAGIIIVAPVETLTRADFERVMAINFWGVLNTTLAVLPQMRARGGGHIVNITSIGGEIAVPHMLPYTCAKFGAVGFSQGLRAELAGAGIAVTTVVPGLMRTGSYLHALFGGDQADEYRWFALGSSAPAPIAVDAEWAARTIVQATKRRQAQCTFPLPTLLAARVADLFPGTAATVLALVDRVMPAAPAQPTGERPGMAVAADMDAPLLRAATTLGWSAAEEYNQVPPSMEAEAGWRETEADW
jgi:NAD(P)-dependent dehydrogenase (short-subunit alcohol dehydrogenase family)